MSSTTIVIASPPIFDESRLAVAGFLARYSGPTRVSYSGDLRQFFAWCAQVNLGIFELRRGHLELWARSMEERGLARAAISRRLSTVAGFYRICVLDGLLGTPQPSTCDARRCSPSRPRWAWTAWNWPLSSPRPPPADPWTTPWPACSACWACASRRPARSTSRTSLLSAAIASSPFSAKARSWP